jgi:hypothetical protein
MSAKGKVLLVGSVGLPDVETVFRSLSQSLGAIAPRYPDGECGQRANWISWQRDVFHGNPAIDLVEKKDVIFAGAPRTLEKFGLKPGTSPESVDLGPLGYAREAIQSYQVFEKLRQDGAIPAGTRMQMSLPSPVAVITHFFVPDDQPTVAKIYEAALANEIAAMLEEIPPEDLAIQWDVCQEVLAAAGAWQVYYDDLIGDAVDGLARYSTYVPDACELGFHLCYGDPGHRHIVEPESLEICVQFANGIGSSVERDVGWIHMPVPRDRDDEPYFAPLKSMELRPQTELYLGLVHMTDGLDGAKRRVASAKAFRADFGVATECGFGRRPAETIPKLLELHAEIAGL